MSTLSFSSVLGLPVDLVVLVLVEAADSDVVAHSKDTAPSFQPNPILPTSPAHYPSPAEP